MLRFAGRRLAGAALTLLLTSFAVFAGVYLAPGSPIAFLIGRHTVPPEQIAAVRAQYHLDDPFFLRYARWVGDVLHGNFGSSIVFQQRVTSLLAPRLATTALLIGYAATIVLVGATALGLVAGLRGGRVDRLVLGVTSFGLAVPSFVASIVLLYVFSVRLGWFPTFGAGSGLVDRLWHLTLPAVSLAVSSLALLARHTRTAVRQERGREHVQTAVARGLSHRDVVWRHVVRNALIPVSTAGGLTVASMIVGVAVVEQAFSVEGLGAYLVESVGANDFPVVQAIALVMAAGYIVLNTAVDLLYLAIDPRVSLGSAT